MKQQEQYLDLDWVKVDHHAAKARKKVTQVGKYLVREVVHGEWLVTTHRGETIDAFENRAAAVAFAKAVTGKR